VAYDDIWNVVSGCFLLMTGRISRPHQCCYVLGSGTCWLVIWSDDRGRLIQS